MTAKQREQWEKGYEELKEYFSKVRRLNTRSRRDFRLCELKISK